MITTLVLFPAFNTNRIVSEAQLCHSQKLWLGKSPNLFESQISSLANGDHYSYIKAVWELVQGTTLGNSYYIKGLQQMGQEVLLLLSFPATEDINILAYSLPVFFSLIQLYSRNHNLQVLFYSWCYTIFIVLHDRIYLDQNYFYSYIRAQGKNRMYMEFDNFMLKARMMQTNATWLRKGTQCLRIRSAGEDLKLMQYVQFGSLISQGGNSGSL